MAVEVGRRGVLTDAKDGNGIAYEVRSMSGSGNTIYAVNEAGESKKFVLRKDGLFRETGYRNGNNLVFAADALEAMDEAESVIETLSS